MQKKNEQPIKFFSVQQKGFSGEVDRALQSERLRNFLRQYAGSLSAIVLTLTITAGLYTIWIQQESKATESYAIRYENILATLATEHTEEDIHKNIVELTQLINDANSIHSPYAILASLQKAAALIRHNELEEAILIYRKISANSRVPSPYRDVATLLAALNKLNSGVSIDYTEELALLNPLTQASSPWRFSALEISAILAIQKRDVAVAHEMLSSLVNDLQTPDSVRTRASILLLQYCKVVP